MPFYETIIFHTKVVWFAKMFFAVFLLSNDEI